MSSDEDIDELTDREMLPQANEFRLSGVLPPPRQVNFTTKTLGEQIRDGSIDLNPEYQRDVVWSLNKQVALIDSIFKNYYVPPVILAVNHAGDGTEEKVCIDGKQRLTAINLFLRGSIYYLDPETKTKLFYKDDPLAIRFKNKKLLPERYRKIFASRQIACIEFSGLGDEEIRDMFQRVQQGMTLNTAERMRAIPGPMSDFVKKLDHYYFNVLRLGKNLALNEKRNSNMYNIARYIWVYARWPGRRTTPTQKELHDFLTDPGEPSDHLVSKATTALKFFSKLAKDVRYMERFRRKEIFAPVEFIFSALLITLHKDFLTKEEISRGIGLMRREIRLAFPDQVRMNKACCAMLYNFVANLTRTKMDLKEAELNDIGRRRLGGAGRRREKDVEIELTSPIPVLPQKRKRVTSPMPTPSSPLM